ncbi:MAG: hypothetical protein AAGI07_07090 [Bacteroidota bacterium]
MTEKAIFFIFVLTVAFIIGFITAWLYFRRKWKYPLGELQGEMLKQSSKISTLEAENKSLKDQLAAAEKAKKAYENAQLESETVEVTAKVQTDDNDKAALVEEVAKLKMLLDGRPVVEEFDQLKIEKQKLSANNKQILVKMEQLQAELNDCRSKQEIPISTPAKALMFTDADISEKDDLKIINGIGPFIETKLNNIGIYTYRQISNFDDPLVDKVTAAIEFFPGRIARDKWVNQAKDLYEKKKQKS